MNMILTANTKKHHPEQGIKLLGLLLTWSAPLANRNGLA
jgi:hypothetical protein